MLTLALFLWRAHIENWQKSSPAAPTAEASADSLLSSREQRNLRVYGSGGGSK